MRLKDVRSAAKSQAAFPSKAYSEKDGILANLLVLEMMEFEKKPLSKIWRIWVAEIGSDLSQTRRYAPLSFHPEGFPGTPDQVPARIPSPERGHKSRALDGLKTLFGRLHLCPASTSGTEPIMRSATKRPMPPAWKR